jgi:hypothetical protein
VALARYYEEVEADEASSGDSDLTAEGLFNMPHTQWRFAEKDVAKLKRYISHLTKRHEIDPRLDIVEFRLWFEAIKEDDDRTAEKLLTSLAWSEKLFICNTRFDFRSMLNIERHTDKNLQYYLPFILAVLFGSKCVIRLLCRNGVDIYRADVGGNNVVHALCWMAFYYPQEEKTMCEMYRFLLEVVPHTGARRTQLLHHENDTRLRPIELAARLGTFRLLSSIFETEYVYKFSKGYIGIKEEVYYNMLEYEDVSSRRRLRSPLRYFLYILASDLNKSSCTDLFSNPVITRWISAKVKRNLPYLIIWFLLRLMFVIMFFNTGMESGLFTLKKNCNNGVDVTTGSNRTNGILNYTSLRGKINFTTTQQSAPKLLESATTSKDIANQVCSIYMTIFGLCSIIFDIGEFIVKFIYQRRSRQLYLRPGTDHNYVISSSLYRITQFLTVAMVLVHATGTVVELLPFICVLITWSMMYFVQFLPIIGHLVIGLQKMLLTFCGFFFLFFILFVSFSQAFSDTFRIACRGKDSTGFFDGLYETFLVMLNIRTFSDGRGHYQKDIMILHVVFVVVMVIMMLNFLIAVMTDAVTHVTRNKNLIQMLEKLDGARTIEDRVLWIVSKVFKQQQPNVGLIHISQRAKGTGRSIVGQ